MSRSAVWASCRARCISLAGIGGTGGFDITPGGIGEAYEVGRRLILNGYRGKGLSYSTPGPETSAPEDLLRDGAEVYSTRFSLFCSMIWAILYNAQHVALSDAYRKPVSRSYAGPHALPISENLAIGQAIGDLR